jgi:5-methylcytosine-specific restriction endonuclease McrA
MDRTGAHAGEHTAHTCRHDACQRPKWARGLCDTHYTQDRRLRLGLNHNKQQVACARCGRLCWKRREPGKAYKARYCSYECRDVPKSTEIVGPVPRSWCAIPQSHPAREAKHHPRMWVSAQCRLCLSWFVDRQTQARYCSVRCSQRWHRREDKKRRGRNHIRTSVRQAVYARDQGFCQLCGEQVDLTLPHTHPMGPTVDHIECRSWVLIPDHTERNLRLAHRSCNSSRGNRPQ